MICPFKNVDKYILDKSVEELNQLVNKENKDLQDNISSFSSSSSENCQFEHDINSTIPICDLFKLQ